MRRQTITPNPWLRQEREVRGWSLGRVAEELHSHFPGVAVTGKDVGRWERGTRLPSPYYRERLCAIFGKTAVELGFLEPLSLQSGHHALAPFLVPLPVPGPAGAAGEALPALRLERLPIEATPGDWPRWFALKLAQVFTLVQQWSGPALRWEPLQQCIAEEIRMFDPMTPPTPDLTYTVSRRQAILALAALPLALLGDLHRRPTPARIEDFLASCAASITACWQLLKGREFAEVHETLSAYVPELARLAQQPSRYQVAAARLATQAYRQLGLVMLHRNGSDARESYSRQALHYGKLADDPGSLVAASISLGQVFFYRQEPAQATQFYQQALPYAEAIPPLQRSRLSAELAVVSAQQGQEPEALRYLKLAQDTYPEQPETDPSFLHAEFSPSHLVLREGTTWLALSQQFPERGYAQRASETFVQIEAQQGKGSVPIRIFFEIINQQAETALALRDQERFTAYLERGVQGAKVLNSQQRRQEAAEVYKQARTVWPGEARIAALADLFI